MTSGRLDRGVDLRAQPAARPAESVIARFVPAAARILVIQPSPYVLFEPRTFLPNNTFGGGRVLMRPHDRGIDRHRPIDPASSVGLGLDHSQQHVPGPVGSETMMPLPHRLPRAEPLGKITPRHPGAITENDPLDHLAQTLATAPRSILQNWLMSLCSFAKRIRPGSVSS
jgi:hypothetical protein